MNERWDDTRLNLLQALYDLEATGRVITAMDVIRVIEKPRHWDRSVVLAAVEAHLVEEAA